MMFTGLIVTLSLAALTLGAPAQATVYRSCTEDNAVALTFDGGPYLYSKQLIDTLTSAGARATFFYTGSNRECIYDMADVVQYADSRGHQVATETWSHTLLTNLNATKLDAEIERVHEAIERIINKVPAFLRPPYGRYNSRVLTAAANHGVDLVIWDWNANDRGEDDLTPAKQKKNFAKKIAKHPNNLLSLQHESYKANVVDVVPDVLQQFKAAGYNLVTVAECVGKPAYQSRSTLQPAQFPAKC